MNLSEVIGRSRRVVFFGGAGVSTESGIPDFRSGGGLYNRASGLRRRPEEILSRSFFDHHPDEFFAYYRTHLLYPQALPNNAHRALAALERAGKVTAVLTQNIDGLHQLAGSQHVLELHGSVHRNTCQGCGRRFGLAFILASRGIPRCDACGGLVKPDVVLYEEALDPDVIDAAIEELARADTLIVGGTSLVVHPAAGLVQAFGGHDLVLINREATAYDRFATLVVREPIGEALAAFARPADRPADQTVHVESPPSSTPGRAGRLSARWAVR